MIKVQASGLTGVVTPVGLDTALRLALGALVYGMSTGPGYVVAWLDDTAPAEEQALALTVLNAHNQLVVLTNKATITADGSDTATITCNDAAISADAAITYTVWLDDSLYAEGSATLASGAAELTLATGVAGVYLIEIRRQSGNFASGYVEVIAE